MAVLPVRFEYALGTSADAISAATLLGSWDDAGRPSADAWRAHPMRRETAADGSDAFIAEVAFDDVSAGADFAWGVVVERDDGARSWGIAAEVSNLGSTAQERAFKLRTSNGAPQREAYRLTHHRARGARALATPDAGPRPIRFAAWAPNARSVEVVFGGVSGYVADDGDGIDPALALLAMTRDEHGMWSALDPSSAVGGHMRAFFGA